MDVIWPHWLRPLWLLLLPLLVWLFWRIWHRERRSGSWQLLLPAAFQAVLLSGGNQRQSRLPWIALGLAWLLALLALLGPSWQRIEQPSQKRADPLVIILDLSSTMLAKDVPPNRLEQAKRKLLDLIQARAEAQTAIVVFAGSAHTLIPLSDDLATTNNLLEAIRPSIMPSPGRRADLGVTRAIELLKQGAQGRGRLLLIGSELSDEERQGIRQALAGHSNKLNILGIGTAQGAPIESDDGSLMKDASGNILLPRLDEQGLRRFADEVGGRYRTIAFDDRDLKSLGLLDGPRSLREDGEPTRLSAWADQGYWLLLPLLLLAACAGRRGWLFCLPLLVLLAPRPSYAFEFDDLWLRPDQQGQRLLQAEKPKEAASRFEDPQWQGEALYRAGDYPAAAARFAQGDSAAAHYNRGNALAKSNELEAAIDAYDQALEQQPDLLPARQNKALVEQLLQQQKQQQKQNSQQQDQQQSSAPQQQQNDKPQPSQQPKSDQSQPNDEGQTGQKQPQDQDRQGQQTPQQPQAKPENNEAQQQPAQSGEQSQDAPKPARAEAGEALSDERRDALEQWLRQIPDEPGELLRRKFLYEQQRRQEQNR
ncbi:VWA domain-containing protein [Pseudomonas sp. LRF_L74]|uniref:VWA domain-containing protein n=1 Tax=Pseudomonas sp. LRF_L74 TaxID=3369422 RepID=UPI003F5E322B